jgi:hypothetical protein
VCVCVYLNVAYHVLLKCLKNCIFPLSARPNGSHFNQASLYSRQEHNLESTKLVGIYTDSASFVTGFKNSMVSSLCKHTEAIGLQNK